MKTAIPVTLAFALLGSGLLGCQTAPQTPAARQTLQANAQAALATFREKVPDLDTFLSNAHGYAIFPSVAKAGLGIGGAYGRGEVYEQGRFVGYADVTQASIGLQIGGQGFDQLLVFENQEAFDRFRFGKPKPLASASVVILQAGAAATAKYANGVAVFVNPRAGAMAEAAIGGQDFGFEAATR
jgi:lipid-binding SYLF domain-containing protein